MHLQSGTPLWFILLLIEKDKEAYHVLSGMVSQRCEVHFVESSSEAAVLVFAVWGSTCNSHPLFSADDLFESFPEPADQPG